MIGLVSKWIAVVLVLCSLQSPVNAEDSFTPAQLIQCSSECAKRYVNPSDIFFSDNAIFVAQDGILVQVEAIHSDAAGIYFDKQTAKWNCPRCGRRNEGFGSCSRCGWPFNSDDDVYPMGQTKS